jgi:AcrR family transcriptional regulator
MGRVSADQRRQDFIEAAVRVIAEQGMKGATTRRIAEAADAPLATLHYCFHTKEQLFFAVFEYMSTSMVDLQIGDVSAESGLAATAAHIMRSTTEWSLANPNYNPVQYDLILWAARQSGLGERVYELFLDSFAQALAASVGPDEDPAIVRPLARLITSILDGLALQWVADRDDARWRADVELGCNMIAAYVAGSPDLGRSLWQAAADPSGSLASRAI